MAARLGKRKQLEPESANGDLDDEALQSSESLSSDQAEEAEGCEDQEEDGAVAAGTDAGEGDVRPSKLRALSRDEEDMLAASELSSDSAALQLERVGCYASRGSQSVL